MSTVTVQGLASQHVAVVGMDPQTVTVTAPAVPQSVGVQGGIPGPPGASTGVPGPSGQPRWTGQGTPGTIIGAAPGDEYLDTLTGVIYQLI